MTGRPPGCVELLIGLQFSRRVAERGERLMDCVWSEEGSLTVTPGMDGGITPLLFCL